MNNNSEPMMGKNNNMNVISEVVTGTNTMIQVEPTNVIGTNITTVDVSSVLPGSCENNTIELMMGKNDNTHIPIEVVTGTNNEEPINVIGRNTLTVDVSNDDVTVDISSKVVAGTNIITQIELTDVPHSNIASVNGSDKLDITSTMNIDSTSSTITDTEPDIDTTNGVNQTITLTNHSIAVIQSTHIVPSLKDCCHSSMSCHEPALNIDTTLDIEHANIDHSYGFGHKHDSNRKSCNPDDLALDPNGIPDNPLFINTTDSAGDINVVIDSMAADIPVCMDDTSHIHQTDLFAALEDDQTQLMDTSDDSVSAVKYDPTGTELTLPLKKRKPILRNPEKTVAELWKQDALSQRWSIPLTKLDSRKIYELSHKPPNWSEMDPYSDSDIEIVTTT